MSLETAVAKINENFTAAGIAIDSKQDTLSAGSGVDITENVISVTITQPDLSGYAHTSDLVTYSAGSGISIGSGHVISSTADLTAYETTQALATSLNALNETIASKADTSALTAYETTQALSTALSNYATTGQLVGKANTTDIVTYSAGSGISIGSGHVISSTVTSPDLSGYAHTTDIVTYSAGSGISIGSGVITCTVVDTDTTYSAGSGIAISPQHVISSTVTSPDLSGYAHTTDLVTYSAGSGISIGSGHVISSTVSSGSGKADSNNAVLTGTVQINDVVTTISTEDTGFEVAMGNDNAGYNYQCDAEDEVYLSFHSGTTTDGDIIIYANKFDGHWAGQAIDDAHIASAATWNAKLGANGGTVASLTVAGQTTEKTGIDFSQVSCPTTQTLTLTSGGSNLGVGTYYYGISYVTAVGETAALNGAEWRNSNSLVNPSITTDSVHRKVTITLPVSADARVTGRKIYRTLVNGAYYSVKLVATIANNTATSYVDDIADGSLTTGDGYNQGNTTNRLITLNNLTAMRIGTNTTLGADAGTDLTSGAANTLIGKSSGRAITTGSTNVCIGDYAGAYNSTSGYNTSIGVYADYTGTGGCNTAVGGCAGFQQTTGNYNTWAGYSAGAANVAYSNSVMVGAYAGAYETGSSKLFIDGIDRGTEAASRTNSIIYGVMNTTPTSQILHLNAVVFPISATTVAAPSYVEGGIYYDTTLHKLRVGGASGWETVTSSL
jgi:hypothetical protein